MFSLLPVMVAVLYGAALWAYHTLLGKPRNFIMKGAYWGRENSPAEISAFLRESNIRHRVFSTEDEMIDTVVDRIANGKVIGWVAGPL